MSRYNFSHQPYRLDQQSIKWRGSEQDPDLLQLWVADMDFEPLPAIRSALSQYADQHIFGYSYASQGLYQAIQAWEKDQHGYAIEEEAIVLIEGVVPAISVAIQAFTQPGDSVLIQTPVYPPFARTVKLNDRQLVCHSLEEKEGQFYMDMVRLEEDLVTHQVKLMLFCNPHNPGGRVWTKEEIQQVGQLCQRHGVILVSDEIHQDLTLFGHKHHSVNTVHDQFKDFTIVLASATKTFNIAGTKNSFALIENPVLRKQFVRRQLANNQHEIPTVGLIATQVALEEGREWLTELKQVLEANIDFVTDYLTTYSRIKVMKPQATYLIWLDFSAYGLDHQELQEALRNKAKVVLNDGQTFGREGRHHARLNAAAPLAVIKEACRRLVAVFGN